VKIIVAVVLVALSFASALEIQSSVSPSRVHPSPAMQRLRAMHAVTRGNLSVAGVNLGDCGPLCELDLPGLIAYNGYPVETHALESIDGAVTLYMYRIPCGTNARACEGQSRPPVLLQHGLLDSGTTWVLNPTDDALAYILADAGYDVWIGNNRGNTYSPCETDDCWRFSYDEMALYDLPTFIYHILNTTNYTTLSYVGHSEGTTQAFASFSALPDIAAKVNVFVALAPAVLVNNQQSPLVTMLVDLHADALFQIFGFKSFLPSNFLLKMIASLFCSGGIFTPICEDVIFALCGVDPMKNHDFNITRAEVYLTHTPAGTSVQNMAHWAQAVRNSEFQMFDFGTSGNMIKYGQENPPVYDLSNFSVPTAIFSGGHDFLADPTDVEQLMNLLPKNIQIYNQYEEDYSHLDFVWGIDAGQRIYPNVLTLLKKFAPPKL